MLWILADVATIPLIAWAWLRWFRGGHLTPRSSWPSLLALLLATASATLALGSIAYSNATGGFAYYDHHLMRIYRTGTLLSTAALLTGLVGTAFPGAIRWQAPLASFGTLLFWLLAAIGE